ncbi:hypothetical protein [Xylophilus sp.]|uniref:hypothetical protein n=1 Tax=Xylophilus sp. TaxID=2653893 RepID=UPI0013BCD17D|nr:hypothetical protein [Xylophilus sp.]KAF1049190.1 MAG: hypothetical protein GAK38_00958 [Xylophilus sp.]
MSGTPHTRHLAGFQCLQFGPSDRSRPAILWLHGVGARGNDISLVAKYGLPAALLAARAATNATVVCPQLEAHAEWQPLRVQSLVSTLRETHRNIVLIGFSLGGLGVCDLLCQGGPAADLNVTLAGRARDLPQVGQTGVRFLAVSGELDPWPQMGAFVRRVVELGGTAEEHIMAGQGHYISESGLIHERFQTLIGSLGVGVRLSSGGG